MSNEDTTTLYEASITIKRIESLITAARKQARQSAHQSDLNLLDEVKALVKMNEYVLRSHHLEVTCEVEPIHFAASAPDFFRVLQNLLGNAIDAYDEISIDGRKNIAIHSATSSREWTLSITDHGVGIDPAIMSEIFTPFFTTKENNRNTGIGLGYCKEYIEKEMGGKLTVRSNEEGTTFTITIPTT